MLDPAMAVIPVYWVGTAWEKHGKADSDGCSVLFDKRIVSGDGPGNCENRIVPGVVKVDAYEDDALFDAVKEDISFERSEVPDPDESCLLEQSWELRANRFSLNPRAVCYLKGSNKDNKAMHYTLLSGDRARECPYGVTHGR